MKCKKSKLGSMLVNLKTLFSVKNLQQMFIKGNLLYKENPHH